MGDIRHLRQNHPSGTNYLGLPALPPAGPQGTEVEVTQEVAIHVGAALNNKQKYDPFISVCGGTVWYDHRNYDTQEDALRAAERRIAQLFIDGTH